MPRLSQAERDNALGRLQAGQGQSEVAHYFNVSQSTLSRLLSRQRTTGSTADRTRSGRPLVTTPAQDRYIRISHLRNRFQSASATAQQLAGGRRVSDQTVRNRLHAAGLSARRPVRGPVLTQRHRVNRLQWATNHLPWTLRNNWNRVWFSDESHFLLQRHDRRRRVYRRRGERFAQACVDEAPAHGGGGVMVWGAIHFAGRSPLVRVHGALNAQRYVDEIIQPHVLPVMAQPRHIFQQDNARPHTARLTLQTLANNNINVLPWPSMSPDMNPIEHVWDELDRRVRARVNTPINLNELFTALQEEWDTMPADVIRNVIRSMPARCRAVVAAGGGHTPY